ncbi:helix-turn-helix domain-containing protein [Nonomuraea endophytica]|uniref:helix-turn-helix domain-containing protein n=1 Tax=Nonomuraea endophytica TaxID=714136 RepID=UPI0037C88B95
MHPRETVDRALRLSAQGLSDRQIAGVCGVSAGAVRKWRTGDRRARDDPRSSGSCVRCARNPLPPRPPGIYAYLLGLYLGDGHVVHHRRGVYRLMISCSASWPGLVEAAAQAMAAVLPSAVGLLRRPGCVVVNSYSKHWPHLLPQHGPGKKHHRPIVLEPWQEHIADVFPGDLVRGLMHSDGYRGLNRVRRHFNGRDHWYEYPRYLFKNESADILRICGEALDRLGVAWRHSKRNEISVARREAVALLDCHVGPKT